jgi:hypothetical protein
MHDATTDDTGPGMSLLQSALYGVGSVWGAAYVVNHPQEESIMHMFVRLIPQILIGIAAVIQAVIAYRKMQQAEKAK